jgi:hypothetical protein
MANIKLSDYCKQNGISYITGYRWFKDGKLPVKAYQTESGTILVEDDSPPAPTAATIDGVTDATSLFLKKTLEFSRNNSSIEDFAAYIFSNFKLKLHSQDPPPPKYSKIKPKPEEVQEHFKKILDKTSAHSKDKPKPNMYIPDPETWENISGGSALKLESSGEETPEAALLQTNYTAALSNINNKADFPHTFGMVKCGNLLTLGNSDISFGESNASYNCASPSFDSSLSDLSATSCGLDLNTSYFVSSPIAEAVDDIERTIVDKPKRGRPRKATRNE